VRVGGEVVVVRVGNMMKGQKKLGETREQTTLVSARGQDLKLRSFGSQPDDYREEEKGQKTVSYTHLPPEQPRDFPSCISSSLI